MVSSFEIQSKYNKLYTCLMQYIWPYHVAEHIASLEIAAYQAFPNISKISSCLNTLESDCRRYISKDEEVFDTIQDLKDLLESETNIYYKL